MTDSTDIVFYDIASNEPLRTFAPNPWKIRYALNFKQVAYTTKWVDMPDIASVREQLGVPANRTLPNGKPYHTLPVIHDRSTGKIIGDSFEIVLYLDKTYPNLPQLIKPGTTGLTAAFNAQVDTLFTKYTTLASQMPFDARVLEKIQTMFAQRMEGTPYENFQTAQLDREEMFTQFERSLHEFSKAYSHVGGTTDHFWSKTGTAAAQAQRSGREQVGPFLDGDTPAYADFIVGAWLAMFEASSTPEDWQRMRSWDGGFWARLHDALAPYREIK